MPFHLHAHTELSHCSCSELFQGSCCLLNRYFSSIKGVSYHIIRANMRKNKSPSNRFLMLMSTTIGSLQNGINAKHTHTHISCGECMLYPSMDSRYCKIEYQIPVTHNWIFLFIVFSLMRMRHKLLLLLLLSFHLRAILNSSRCREEETERERKRNMKLTVRLRLGIARMHSGLIRKAKFSTCQLTKKSIRSGKICDENFLRMKDLSHFSFISFIASFRIESEEVFDHVMVHNNFVRYNFLQFSRSNI